MMKEFDDARAPVEASASESADEEMAAQEGSRGWYNPPPPTAGWGQPPKPSYDYHNNNHYNQGNNHYNNNNRYNDNRYNDNRGHNHNQGGRTPSPVVNERYPDPRYYA